ncbi:glycosyltransferase family 2 protein [Acidiphilium sp.]|uniref:glycosyltransferase family 2 protein n=1 Tax=Acidiphilium sp. TaxID=527 RepID=UPI003D06B437
MSITLNPVLRMNSPRWTPSPTPWRSVAIHGAVMLVWVVLFANAFFAHGISGWSVGIVYIAYDTALLAFTVWQTWPLRRAVAPGAAAGQRPTLGVIVAAYNEAAVLEATVAGLLGQSDPPEAIVIADDGSSDGTAAVMRAVYGLEAPMLGAISAPSMVVPQLRWLRLAHGGKAVALNASLVHLDTDLVLTVDADTILEREAIGAMRDAFAATPGLVAATGVLTPVCDGSVTGRVFEWFQTYEYVRNFLSRYAWMRQDSLLLISGAFAGFRRDAVALVGGFDPDCLVEDYELIHRLRRYGFMHGLSWHSAVIGGARGRTSAPGSLPAFLRQRRRWFGGFLQTQFWYRDMVGAARYRRLGTWMLPVKAIDTMQPVYGLCAFALLLWYIATGRVSMLIPVGGFILGKIVIDLGFHGWSVHLYRNWVGGRTRAEPGLAILAAVIEPFSFQLFRHMGATWGWLYFLTGKRAWGVQQRGAMVADRS